MERSLKSLAIAIALLAAPGAAATGPAFAQDDGRCLNKREIQQRIDAGQLRQLSEAMSAAGIDGKIISTTAKVCQSGGRLHWEINVMDANGESRPVSLPAN